jgi:hypothetical protein
MIVMRPGVHAGPIWNTCRWQQARRGGNGRHLILTGVLGSIHQESISRVRAPPADLSVLAKFARFPQGPPPGLDLLSLRPRPRHERAERRPVLRF